MIVLIASLLLAQTPTTTTKQAGVQIIRPRAKGSAAPVNNHGIQRVDCKATPEICGMGAKRAEGDNSPKVIHVGGTGAPKPAAAPAEAPAASGTTVDTATGTKEPAEDVQKKADEHGAAVREEVKSAADKLAGQ